MHWGAGAEAWGRWMRQVYHGRTLSLLCIHPHCAAVWAACFDSVTKTSWQTEGIKGSVSCTWVEPCDGLRWLRPWGSRGRSAGLNAWKAGELFNAVSFEMHARYRERKLDLKCTFTVSITSMTDQLCYDNFVSKQFHMVSKQVILLVCGFFLGFLLSDM